MNCICKTSKCTGCGACAAVCPRNCIQMKEGGDGFFHAERNQDCENGCSFVCPQLTSKKQPVAGCYACLLYTSRCV